MIEILFWVLLFIIFYGYVGYGILLAFIILIRRSLGYTRKLVDPDFQPEVTLLIAAYNEIEFIEDKIKNCLALDYPKEKLKIVFVTDGSDDGTPDKIRQFATIELHHQPERKGKIAAVNRVMPLITTPVTIFCDANTLLNKEAIKNIVRHFADEGVGCVAGEKKILLSEKEAASGAGEGLYWKYESFLKKLDSELYTVVGAAGELFAVRTKLFEQMESNAIIEDFVMSLRIAQKGFRVVYEPEACALETSSANVKEELKRKVRICAGGIQSIVWLKDLLNPFKYGTLTFQYVSHRVLRWSLIPLFLLLAFPINIYLVGVSQSILYSVLLFGQVAFYVAALLGWYLQHKRIKVKALFVPYYFFIMNLSVYLGFVRYLRGRQSVLWERAKRA